MIQPSISFYGFTIYEPVTAFTNFILSGYCFAFGLNVGKSHAKYWAAFFYVVALAAFFAAFGHGLFINKNNSFQLISRCTNIFAVYIASIATILLIKNKKLTYLLNVFSLVQMLVALVCIAIYYEFWVVKWDAILGLGVIVGGVNIFFASKGNKGSRIILVGVLINALTAYIHSNKISIIIWFNHNDIGHIMLIIGFYFMAKGAIKLQENAIS